MKTLKLSLIYLILFSGSTLFAQCPFFSISLDSQNEVDSFSINYPDCTELFADLSIIATDITNLDSLASITNLGGSLKVYANDSLFSIEGLQNLTTIGRDLIFLNNDTLTSLSGLENLISIGHSLEIRGNGLLEDIESLEGLTVVPGFLKVVDNPSLTSINGLHNIDSIYFSVTISTDTSLTSLAGLESLTYVRGNFEINNTSITNLEGLGNLETIIFDLKLRNNRFLADLSGIDQLSFIGDGVLIETNEVLESIEGISNGVQNTNGLSINNNISLLNLNGLENLTTLGAIGIRDNPVLTSLQGLKNVTAINGTLTIDNNDALTDLTGLEDLNTVGGIFLIIRDNDNLVSLSGLDNLTEVGEDIWISNNNLLTDLNGLNQLTTVGETLDINGNDGLLSLVGLDNLTTVAQDVRIQNNASLTSLAGMPSLTEIGEDLFITDNHVLNDLSGLENVTTIGLDLRIFDNDNLNSLNGISLDSIGASIEIGNNNSLTNLNGLESIVHIGNIFRVSDHDNLLSLQGMNNLNSIDGQIRIYANEVLSSFSGLENLEVVNQAIRIYNNTMLTDISSIQNVDFSNVAFLSIYDNPNLAICDQLNICDYLGSGGIVNTLESNAQGCNTVGQILNECASNLAKIQLEIYYDLNQNQMRDSGEPLLPGIAVNVNPSGDIIFSNTTNGGLFFPELGTYDLEIDLSMTSQWVLTTTNTNYQVTIDNTLSCDILSFGLYPIEETTDATTIIYGPPARCGTFRTFAVSANNTGTLPLDGTLWLEADAILDADSTIFVDMPDTIVGTNIYGWHFQELFPGYAETKEITFKIPIPPVVELGDSLHFISYVDFENASPTGSTFDYKTEVRCSFDPNDKLVTPDRPDQITLFKEGLIYTIRFQNTGNDEAYNIIVKDTLDLNLDASTFRVLGTSHPEALTTRIEDEHVVSFDFQNIYLPDSTTNFEASQGYVMYAIRTIEGLAEETLVTNTASIYFDFNPPIVTNTTENVMVTDFPTAVENIFESDQFKVYPNPVNESLFIEKYTNSDFEYRILDVNGRPLMTSQFSNAIQVIDCSTLFSGIYFIEIVNPVEGRSFIGKIIK